MFAFVLIAALIPMTAAATAAGVNPAKFTVDADFDQGSLINVNHDTADQLELNGVGEPFNFIWVAVSSKGTVVKIDTTTGTVLGEYATTPASQFAGNPSRTTVDNDGSVWVANRNNVFDGFGSVLHIGLEENGQCEDRNSNGTIDTSNGLGNVLPWADATGARNVGTADDECIVHYTQVNSTGTRHVSVDANNDVWVSGFGGLRNFDLVIGGNYSLFNSGTITRSEPSVGFGGYGGLIDGNGVIWSANELLRWDTALPLTGGNGGNWDGYFHDSYGLCIDSTGNVWNTGLSGNQIRKFAPNGTLIGTFSHGFENAQGCVVDGNDDVWVAHSLLGGSSVGHILNDGTYIGIVAVGVGPTGVAVDAMGKIWATNYWDGTVSRIDPLAGPIGADLVTPVGAVNFTSGYLGGNLYNYSDMTGSTLTAPATNGTWSVTHDSEVVGAAWSSVSWTADAPSDSSIIVRVASSTDGVIFGPEQAVTNGGDPTVADDQYLKVSVSFQRATSGETPVLYDLTVTHNRPPVADPNGPYVLDIKDSEFDGSGSADPDLNPLTYFWDFGDTNTGTGELPTHTYAEAGIYEVCLTVNDGFVDSETVCTTAVIYDPDGGFVTGGGTIDSPPGALYPVPLPFFDMSYYELVETGPGLSWDDANTAAMAADLGSCTSHLVTITSQAEQDALFAYFDGALQGKWYGGFQPQNVFPADFGWEWVTGETWAYTNWAGSEPNDAGGSERHLLGWADGWAWNDEGNLGNVTGFVIEYDGCEFVTGHANFGFVSKYKKGAVTPTGNTEFQFQAGDLNFHSDAYDWLVVNQGGIRAQYKGTGTINGALAPTGDAYRFMLWATDDDPDKFRIKIWYEDAGDVVVYDNGFAGSGFETGQPIDGGSIIIHTKKK